MVPTGYDWFYRTTGGTFQPLTSLSPPFPSDLAQTITIDGQTVNYIVRVESGTINESIYRIAILDDPTAPISNPWSVGGTKPGPGWNGKLTYPFGGGCGAGLPLRKQRGQLGAAAPRRSALASRSPRHPQHAGHGLRRRDLADTVMMIKERFIEQYGVPRFTIGSGRSGGAIQQHLIAHNYPGLLDALTPNISYPDITSVAAGRPRLRSPGQLLQHHRQSDGLARRTARRRRRLRGGHHRQHQPHQLQRLGGLRRGLAESDQRLRQLRPPGGPLPSRDQSHGSAGHVLGRHHQRLRARSPHGLRALGLRQRRYPVRARP